jgi:hypothetical protein
MTNSLLARWFGRQLSDWLPHPEIARLYGLTVNDPELIREGRDGAARFIAIADGDPYELLAGPAQAAGESYDALALVALGWAHGHHATGASLTTVVVVTVMSGCSDPAFYVWNPSTGQRVEIGTAQGALVAAARRLGDLAA